LVVLQLRIEPMCLSGVERVMAGGASTRETVTWPCLMLRVYNLA
jgi:hypothetical protein